MSSVTLNGEPPPHLVRLHSGAWAAFSTQDGLVRLRCALGLWLGAGGSAMADPPGVAVLQSLIRGPATASPSNAFDHTSPRRNAVGAKAPGRLAPSTKGNVGEPGKEEIVSKSMAITPMKKERAHKETREGLLDAMCNWQTTNLSQSTGAEEEEESFWTFPPTPPAEHLSELNLPPLLRGPSWEGSDERGRENPLEPIALEVRKSETEGEAPMASSPSSPLRNLIMPAVNFFRGLAGGKQRGKGEGGQPGKPPAKLKADCKRTPRRTRKELFNKALALAKRKPKGNLQFLEKGFCAESARRAKASKINTVVKLLGEANNSGKVWPLKEESLKNLAMALQGAGYKSGPSYLAEAKLLHVEKGHEWNLALDRCYKKCMISLKRNTGPRNQAPEVPKDKRRSHASSSTRFSTGVLFAREVFLFAMVWMLRAIELTALRLSDLDFSAGSKVASLTWRTSKTDQAGEGTRRTIRCNCQGHCDAECPYNVTETLAQKLMQRCSGDTFILIKKAGSRASAGEIIRAWTKVFGMKVSGHSARRTGALNYIRCGWGISQVAYLGRWKSNIILHYASEALQEVPVNTAALPSFSPFAQMEEGVSEAEWKQFKESTKEYVEWLKNNTEKGIADLQAEVDLLKREVKDSHMLPPKVKSLYAGNAVHLNEQRSTFVPPLLWKTRCGWNFFGKPFTFAQEDVETTCLKCIRAEQGGSGTADAQLWGFWVATDETYRVAIQMPENFKVQSTSNHLGKESDFSLRVGGGLSLCLWRKQKTWRCFLRDKICEVWWWMDCLIYGAILATRRRPKWPKQFAFHTHPTLVTLISPTGGSGTADAQLWGFWVATDETYRVAIQMPENFKVQSTSNHLGKESDFSLRVGGGLSLCPFFKWERTWGPRVASLQRLFGRSLRLQDFEGLLPFHDLPKCRVVIAAARMCLDAGKCRWAIVERAAATSCYQGRSAVSFLSFAESTLKQTAFGFGTRIARRPWLWTPIWGRPTASAASHSGSWGSTERPRRIWTRRDGPVAGRWWRWSC